MKSSSSKSMPPYGGSPVGRKNKIPKEMSPYGRSAVGRRKRIPHEMQLLADYLKRVRTDLGLSMHEVARRTTLTPSYISKIESGTAFQTISAHGLVEFSKCYSMPASIILEKAGFTPESDDDLPGLAPYLRLRYKAPHQAVQEMEIAWSIIKQKYGL